MNQPNVPTLLRVIRSYLQAIEPRVPHDALDHHRGASLALKTLEHLFHPLGGLPVCHGAEPEETISRVSGPPVCHGAEPEETISG